MSRGAALSVCSIWLCCLMQPLLSCLAAACHGAFPVHRSDLLLRRGSKALYVRFWPLLLPPIGGMLMFSCGTHCLYLSSVITITLVAYVLRAML